MIEGFDELLALAEAISPTGSREICNPPPVDTDIDFVVYVLKDNYSKFDKKLLDLGFEKARTYGDTDFVSYKMMPVNFIVVTNHGIYLNWLFATQLAKKLNLVYKPDRITLFTAILYGRVDDDDKSIPF